MVEGTLGAHGSIWLDGSLGIHGSIWIDGSLYCFVSVNHCGSLSEGVSVVPHGSLPRGVSVVPYGSLSGIGSVPLPGSLWPNVSVPSDGSLVLPVSIHVRGSLCCRVSVCPLGSLVCFVSVHFCGSVLGHRVRRVAARDAGVSRQRLPVLPLLYTRRLTHYVGTYVGRLLCLQCKPVNLICQALLADLRNGMTFWFCAASVTLSARASATSFQQVGRPEGMRVPRPR